jgi:hypothetical protein
MSRPKNYDLSASFVSLHAAMRPDDLVEVESHANLDVPCASWGLTDQFLKGFRMKNFQFSAIRGLAQ